MPGLVSQLKALGEKNRLEVTLLLAGGPSSGIELLQRLPEMSQPSLSRHLGVLRDAGLVLEEKRGRRVLYRLVPNPLLDLVVRAIPLATHPVSSKNMPNETSVEFEPRDDFQEWLR